MSIRLAERSAEDGEVLGEDVNEASIDAAVPGNDAVAGVLLLLHSEVETSMLDEFVELLEGTFVQQKRNPIARRQFAFRFLPFKTLGATAELGGTVQLEETLDAGRYGDLHHGKLEATT